MDGEEPPGLWGAPVGSAVSLTPPQRPGSQSHSAKNVFSPPQRNKDSVRRMMNVKSR